MKRDLAGECLYQWRGEQTVESQRVSVTHLNHDCRERETIASLHRMGFRRIIHPLKVPVDNITGIHATPSWSVLRLLTTYAFSSPPGIQVKMC